ncbi:hypothetical protein [Paraliomyxa miuraensis]|uniref:hypothetical protein n=1 Tax=Paraliomyxa miuraensis TaxID=376150 RepID=UPI002255F4C6|nr:hypothetical protein [Paraliomyxa miuraensis]MCX4242603.1 hypothetical protein [Paraliomyxa miuraensis]
MIATISSLAVALALAPEPPIQRPTAPVSAPDASAPATESVAVEAEATPPEEPPTTDVASEPTAEADPVTTEVEATSEPATEAAPAQGGEQLHVATERPGPPYYTEEDLAELRARHEVIVESPPPRAPARWRCLIADPTCRHTFELQAMGAYALRVRQGDTTGDSVDRWSSARAQYDFWMSLPALAETEGKSRYTRISLGPKGGVIFSDTGDLWGNLGIAMRYWLGRGRWAPSIEVTSALSFKLGTKTPRGDADLDPKFRMDRGPVGFTADVGVGIGGFGAIVLGGQYDSPLAREDIPEEYRVYTSGMFYVGFRGNILWGGPAAAAVAAHASTRGVQRP